MAHPDLLDVYLTSHLSFQRLNRDVLKINNLLHNQLVKCITYCLGVMFPPSRAPSLSPSLRGPSHPSLSSPSRITAAHTPALLTSPPPACPCTLPCTWQQASVCQWSRKVCDTLYCRKTRSLGRRSQSRCEAVIDTRRQPSAGSDGRKRSCQRRRGDLSNHNRTITIILQLDYLT